MKILNYRESDFYIAHFQGNSAIKYMPIIEELKQKVIAIPENIQIVTVSSKNLKNPMLLTQLQNSNISWINKAENHSVSWDNTKKIGYIAAALQEVTAEYALVLDSTDVVLTQDLIGLVERFNSYNKRLLFGATKRNYPDVHVDKVKSRDFRGEFRFLNAGTCFGKTADLIDFYNKAEALVNNEEVDNPKKSEQLIIRHVFAEDTENVDFDYQCGIFQTFANTEYRFTDLEKTGIIIE